METEQKLRKGVQERTDEGYSEKKLATQFDLGVSSKQTQSFPSIKIFDKQKKSHTLFQAQKDEEI